MNLDYGLFMAETEGYLDTRESKIQCVIKELVELNRSGVDINSSSVQSEIWNKYKLDPMTMKECDRIKREVEKRI